MKVLGLDPSMSGFGFAVFEAGRPIDCGVWVTWSGRETRAVADDNAKRFTYLASQLWRLAEKVQPERIFVEGLVYLKDTTFTTISGLGRCRGLVDLLGAALKVRVLELSPQAVKKGLGIVRTKDAEGLASKQEVRDAITRLYPEIAPKIPDGKVGENAADALAVAHVGLACVSFQDRLSSGTSR